MVYKMFIVLMLC